MVLTRRISSRAGLALLETLVAAVIFALATVGVAALVVTTNRGSGKAAQRITANAIASQLVEAAIDEARTGGVPVPDTGSIEVKSTRRGFESTTVYQFEVTVANLAGNLRDVAVTVRWSQGEENLSAFREVLVCPMP